MLKIYLITLFFSLVLIRNAFANADCENTFAGLVIEIRKAQKLALGEVPHPQIEWSTETKINDSQKQEVESVLRETDRLLGKHMAVPSRLTIEGHPQYDAPNSADFAFRAFQDRPMNHLILGYQDQLIYKSPGAHGEITASGRKLPPGQKIGTKHPKYTRPTWIHEYAHVYFSANIHTFRREASARLKKHRESQEQERDWAEEEKQIKTKLGLLEEQQRNLEKEGPESANALLKLANEIDLLWERSYELHMLKESNFQPVLAKHGLMVDAFGELFCDTVANVQSGELDAMKSSFNSAGSINGAYDSSGRSYSRRSKQNLNFSDYHNMLQPARLELGKLMKPYLDNPVQRADFLGKFAKVIQAELQSWGTNRDLESITPQEVNQRLIGALHSEFH